MADCLIAYRNFVERVQKENGEEAFMNSDFSDEQVELLKKDLYMADSRIMENNGFWIEQIEMDLEMREDSRNEN